MKPFRRPADPVRERLAAKRREVERKVTADAPLAPEELAERLAEVRHLEAVTRWRRSRPWPGLLLLAFSLAVAVAAFWRVEETDVSLELRLSGLTFVSDRTQMVDPEIELAELGVTGIYDLDFPGDQSFSEDEVEAGAPRALGLTAAEGVLHLAPLMIEPETRVDLETRSGSGLYRVSVSGSERRLVGILFRGRADYSLSTPEMQGELESRVPRLIEVRSRSGEKLDLDLTVDAPREVILAQHLTISHLDLMRRAPTVEHRGGMLHREVSGVVSGRLFFEEVGTASRDLRRGETLRFERVEGELLSLSMAQDGLLQVYFTGRVRGMRSGRKGNSLMPTHIEVLHARSPATLALGLILTAVSLLGGVRSFIREAQGGS